MFSWASMYFYLPLLQVARLSDASTANCHVTRNVIHYVDVSHFTLINIQLPLLVLRSILPPPSSASPQVSHRSNCISHFNCIGTHNFSVSRHDKSVNIFYCRRKRPSGSHFSTVEMSKHMHQLKVIEDQRTKETKVRPSVGRDIRMKWI